MTRTTKRPDLPLVLAELDDQRDRCVAREQAHAASRIEPAEPGGSTRGIV